MAAINNSYLLGLFGAEGGVGALPSARKPKTQPTAPWNLAAQEKPSQTELLRTALSGRKFVNENSAVLDVKGASAGDYRKIFALYQGLSMLEAIVMRASERNLTRLESDQLARRFTVGLTEVTDFLASAQFEGVNIVQGTSATQRQTTAAVARDNPKYMTGPIHEGGLADEVAAFQGDVRFGISVKTILGTRTVDIDLAEMGATPRTLDAVLGHINGKLEAAGVETRIHRQQIESEPRTLKVGDKTITLPAGPTRWGLTVSGTSIETISFVPAESRDAVQVVQGAGTKGGHEVLKFDPDGNPAAGPGERFWVEGRSGVSGLPEGVETVRASAAGPDGSMWVVADVSAGSSTQPIKGQADVVLMKLDSAGKVVVSRALGAASTASGYAIAVDADGRVAVAGSVVGGLAPGETGVSTTLADSFVTVFDADGREQWTHRRGAKAEDEATAVSFDADGRVYVAGRAKSAMPGASVVGGWDGYVQAFSESQVHSLAPIKATATGSTQFGTAGDDNVQAMTVDGDNLYTAGVENGAFVIRHFRIGPSGAPELLATRDLGAARGGEIAGLAVANGRLIVSGATRNGGLDAGQVNNAHAGGMDAFVAALSTDLTASGADRLTYYGGAGDDSAADVKVHDGKVWLTGVSDRALGAKEDVPSRGYLARLDPLTGQVEWSQTWAAADNQAKPLALTVSSGGASVLDRLGLPQGEIDQKDSKALVDATALRAGDRFYVQNPATGRQTAVTIEAKDTLQTLARKIELASGRQLKVTIKTDRDYVTGMDGDTRVTSGGVQRLSITGADGRGGAVLIPGEAGRDALAGLGLSAGFIGKTADEKKTFGVNLPATLNLSSAEGIAKAKDQLVLAIKAMRDAYRALSPEASKPPVTGKAPAYLKAQLANYQAALARLTG
ncbi:transcriptional regulator [Brevundimonas naejangsanensis]|uniref:Transcriptional regulator n=1 Tax=Brevundimonas naejangsanensis TaxID=588932 RepID=A0A494RIK2_9CAUL|nr:transcriptional regulator [Brevundimonas naejangsanensis]AYG93816.1 transcriptional regulator [Brevundimonas naejangsanensis]